MTEDNHESTVHNLRTVALDTENLTSIRKKAVKSLGEIATEEAENKLSEVASESDTDSVQELALEQIQEINSGGDGDSA